MNIIVIGTGYVGLVTGSCLAEMGVNVLCVDIDSQKIGKLKNGVIPIYEPGLEDIVNRNIQSGRLMFSTTVKEHIDIADVVFIAVGTPPNEDGSADLHYVLDAARTIGQCMNQYLVIVTKSTVPVGTAKRVKTVVQEELERRSKELEFDIASNPEFLKEGNAIDDFMKPERVVVGVENERTKEVMTRLYKPMMLNNFRVIFMDILSAEMTKYAANSMLATRISFMNDIANLCELLGADVDMVRQGIGTDSRIGNKFLYAGCGYGGSCFPKDVKALIKIGQNNAYEMKVLQAVEEVNNIQKDILFEKLKKHFNSRLEGKSIALWGLAFKPETDDMREAPSLNLINALLKAKCNVRVYDPVSMQECMKYVGDNVEYCNNKYDAVNDVDVLILITEWKEFRTVDWEVLIEKMRGNVLIDGRNCFERKDVERKGFIYHAIGK